MIGDGPCWRQPVTNSGVIGGDRGRPGDVEGRSDSCMDACRCASESLDIEKVKALYKDGPGLAKKKVGPPC